MTKTTLCVCGKPTSGDAYLCRDCIDLYARALGQVPGLIDELDLTLSKQRRFVLSSGAVVSAASGMPFDVSASHALSALRVELVGLVRLCIDQRVSHHDYRQREPGDSPESMSRWLLWRLDGVAAMSWAADALQLVDVVEHATRVIDRPLDRTYAGPCDGCGSDLYVEKGALDVVCVDCGVSYELAARRDWLLSVVHDRLATAVEISRALSSLELSITTERIRQWRHRGRLIERAHDRAGHPLYRVGDVVDLLTEAARAAS